jgi:hypothetical protein
MSKKYLRKYRAVFEYQAQDSGELSISEGDIIHVHPDKNGEWPDVNKWMRGSNQRTSLSGEFPGNYTTFVMEEEIPPTPPPRRAPRPRSVHESSERSSLDVPPKSLTMSVSQSCSGISTKLNGGPPEGLPDTSLPDPIEGNTGAKKHEWKEVAFKVPFKCTFCGDPIWGSQNIGYQCNDCFCRLHSSCFPIYKCVPCQPPETSDSDEDDNYTHFVESHLDWKCEDVLRWLKAVHFEPYCDLFARHKVDGEKLDGLTRESLEEMGIADPFHLDNIVECINELCRKDSSRHYSIKKAPPKEPAEDVDGLMDRAQSIMSIVSAVSTVSSVGGSKRRKFKGTFWNSLKYIHRIKAGFAQ